MPYTCPHIFSFSAACGTKLSASNEASYQAAFAKWQKGSSSDTQQYFHDSYVWHALDWGQYGALQLADWATAKQAIDRLRPVAEKSTVPRVKEGMGEMRARYIVESEQWEKLPLSSELTSHELMATGLSAIRMGDVATAQQVEEKLGKLEEKKQGARQKLREQALNIMQLEVSALVRLAQGKGDEAESLMDKAASIAEDIGLPNGAAIPIKPAHELYGEILLELDQPQKAMAQFETSLQRTPNRPLSLRGLARAAAKTGDQDTARQAYQNLLEVWGANNTPEALQEAKLFLAKKS